MTSPTERAREAATLKAAEVLKACFEFGGARPVRDIVGEILAEYDASIAAEGMVLVPKTASEAMVKAGMSARFGEVMVGGIRHAEVKLGPPGCQRVWSAMIAAASAHALHEHQRDKPDEHEKG